MATPSAQFDKPLTACPICGSPRICPYDHDYHGRVIFRCRRCGVKFINPQYTDSHLAEYYAKYTRVDRPEGTVRTVTRATAKSDAIRLASRYVRPGRFLSIGCGDGLELELAREQGWQVEGYDVDPETTQRVSKRISATIHSGDFFGLELPANAYDCVFLDQVLEHPKNPQDYLTEIRRILRPGGVVYIGCPNMMSLANFGKTMLGKLGLKSRRGKHYASNHHLFFYSAPVLKNILQRYFGFRVRVAQGDPLGGIQRSAEAGWTGRTLAYFRRELPMLESSFRIVAEKVAESGRESCPRRAA